MIPTGRPGRKLATAGASVQTAAMASRRRVSFRIDPATGIMPAARQVESPNQDSRPPGAVPELIVIHGISLPPADFGGPWIDRLFTNRLDCDAHPYYDALRELRVSAHFFVRRSGRALQFVSCDQRAWHAGVASWKGATSTRRGA